MLKGIIKRRKGKTKQHTQQQKQKNTHTYKKKKKKKKKDEIQSVANIEISFTKPSDYGLFYTDPRNPDIEIQARPGVLMADILTMYEEVSRTTDISVNSSKPTLLKEVPKKDPVPLELKFKLMVLLFFKQTKTNK